MELSFGNGNRLWKLLEFKREKQYLDPPRVRTGLVPLLETALRVTESTLFISDGFRRRVVGRRGKCEPIERAANGDQVFVKYSGRLGETGKERASGTQ